MKPLRITSSTLVNALGVGKAATLDALQQMKTGLVRANDKDIHFDTYIGIVEQLAHVRLAGQWERFDCRNNRLARLCLDADNFKLSASDACKRYGAHRLGIFLGTSTSGIATTEYAYKHRQGPSADLSESFDYLATHNLHSLAAFCRQYLGIKGPGLTISTACSSSSKVFAAASRYIQAGLCDAAIVGGVDSLCLTTLYGFHSLQLVSARPCRPWDAERDGINIGEAAGFALLEQSAEEDGVYLKGYGESSDAYHMSSPHPEGLGASIAIQNSLEMAALSADDIGYINLHGTATVNNDAAEDRAISDTIGIETACSSTKGWTGHTLGAAGITEALISQLVLEQGFLPANLNMSAKDEALHSNILAENRNEEVLNVMTNSFGFGGTNSSLILGKY